MGISKNPNLKGFSGSIDKLVTVRQYSGDRTVLSSFPDMSNVKPSELQKQFRMKFADAQRYAREFLAIPANKAFYKALCKPGQRPHNVLISELLKKDPPATPKEEDGGKRGIIVYGKPIKRPS